MTKFPMSASQIHQLSRWLYRAKTGWIILLSPGRMVGFLGRVIMGMARMRFKTAETLDEALNLLYKEDATLPQPQ
jgi:hypothetical protein